MHAFVRAILLRRSRTDELHCDALIDPPDTQAREPAQGRRGKGWPVVHPDDLGQAVMTRQLLEGSQRASELLVGARATADYIMAEAIADGQRIAAPAIAQKKPAFEVHRPDMIGMSRHGER